MDVPGVNLTARAAHVSDANAIATIYNEGIADRIATFETEPRSAEQVARWFDGRHRSWWSKIGMARCWRSRPRPATAIGPATLALRNSRSMSPAGIVAPVPGASLWPR